ncbi:hypothetical protein COL922a_010479 [Colletotrichum nupharicola]|nr:hypothetical protein COL922a_010479 [Colletotrichum nupharicola]
MFNPYNMQTSFPSENTASSSSSSSWRKGADPSQRSHETADSITYLDIPKPVSSIMADNRRLNGTPMDAKYTRDEVKAAVRTRRENRKNEERLNQQRKEILAKMQAGNGLTRYFFSVFPDGAPIPGITALEDCVLGIRHSKGRKLDTEITEAEVSRALELFADQVKWHNASLTPVGTVSEECVKGSTADTLTMRLETQRLRRKLSETTEQSEGLALLARIDKLVGQRVRATVEKQNAALYPEASGSGIPKRAAKWPESRFQHPKARGGHTKSTTQERIEAWAASERANERADARIKRQNEKTAKQLEWELGQEHAATLRKVFTPTDEELKGLKRSLKPENGGLAKPKENRGDGMKKIIEHLKAGSDSWSTDGNDCSEEQRTAQPLFYSPTKEILDTFKKAWGMPLIKSMFSETSPQETDVKGKGKAVDRSEAGDEAAKRERNLQAFEARQRQMEEDLVVDNGDSEHFLSDVLHDPHWTGRSNPDSFLRGRPQRSNETMSAVLGRASDLSEHEKQWERKEYWADSAAQMEVQLQRVKRQREEKPESETVASASKKTKTEAEADSNERVRKNFRAGFEKWKSENVKQATLAEAYQHLFKGKDGNPEVDQTSTPDDKAAGKQKVDVPYVANPPMTYAPRRQVFPTSNARSEDPEKGDAVSCNFWASPEKQLLNAEARDTSQEDLGSSVVGGLLEELPSIRTAKQSAAAWMHQGPTPPAETSDGRSQSTKEAFHEMMKRIKRGEEAQLQQAQTAAKALKDHAQGKIRSRGNLFGFHHPPPQNPYDTSSFGEAAHTPAGPSFRPGKQNETEKAPGQEKKESRGNGAEMPSGDRPIWATASAYPQPSQRHYLTPKQPSLYVDTLRGQYAPIIAASYGSYNVAPPATVSTPFPQPENRNEAKKTPGQEKNGHISHSYNQRPPLDLKHPYPYRPNYTSPYAPNWTGPSTPYYANWMNYASPSTLNYAAVPAFYSATPPTRPSYPTPYTPNHPLRHTACYDVPPAPVRTETTRAMAQPPRPAPKPPVDFELAYNTLAAKFQNLHISTAATVRALNEDLKRASTSVDRMIQKMAEKEAASSEAPQTSSATRPLYPDVGVPIPEEAADSVAEVDDEVGLYTEGNEPMSYCGPYVEDDEDSINHYNQDDPPTLMDSEEEESSDEDDEDDEDESSDEDDSSDEDESSDEEESSEEEDEDDDESSDEEDEDDDESSEGDQDESLNENEPSCEEESSCEDEPSYEEEPSHEDETVMENEPVMEPEQDETEEDEPEQEQCPCPECQCANASWSHIGGYDDEACDGEDMVCDCAESDDTLLDSCYCATCELLRESGAEVPEEVAVSVASSETEGEAAEVEIGDEDYCILDDEDRDAEQDDEYEWVGEDEFA